MERSEVLISKNGNGLQSTETLSDRIKAVCYIETVFIAQKTGKERLKRGSGFFSKLSLEGCDDVYGVFTNNHVLGTKAEAENAKATFLYEGPRDGESIKLRPEIMFRTHKELDYTFVGVNKEDIDKLQHSIPVQPIPLEPEPELRKDDSIIIFQHPQGRPKEYSQEKISNIEKPFVFYKADTEAGSSGSPVLTTVGLKLIAIHHKGSEEGGYNKGTLSSEVLMHLEKGTYTKPSGIFSDNQDKEIFKDSAENIHEDSVIKESPPAPKRLKGSPVDPEEERASSAVNPEEKKVIKTGIPSGYELQKLSKEIPSCWKDLGRCLGIPDAKIIAFERQNSYDISEQAYQMLLHWKQSKASGATYKALFEALCDDVVSQRELAKNYCCQK
ncbi:hypothetical protein ACROYT_G004506 [Oculina patagonica]